MKKKLPSGLLIQDTTQRSLQVKILDCCESFKDKFGDWPAVVWLHRQTLGNYISPNGLKLEVNGYVRPNCFLVGPLPAVALRWPEIGGEENDA